MILNTSKQISDIKTIVMMAIENDEGIRAAFDRPDLIDPQDFEYENIYPTWKVDDVELTKKTVVCLKVNSARVKNSEVVQKFYIDILIFTNIELQRTPLDSIMRGCTRLDYVSQRIEDLLSRNTELGLGETTLVYNREDFIDNRHPCRLMRFETLGVNANWTFRGE